MKPAPTAQNDRLAHLAWRTMYVAEMTRPNYGIGPPLPAFVRRVLAAPELKTKPDECYWRVRWLRQDGSIYNEERYDQVSVRRFLFPTEEAAWAGLVLWERAKLKRLERQIEQARHELAELEQMARFHRNNAQGAAD